MKTIGNVIWLLFIGLWTCIAYVVIGILLCITIIGIPFGRQCFKLASLVLTPFGRDVKTKFESHPIANVIWLILAGWELALAYIAVGVLFCISIIGIPFGMQCIKLAILSLFPFGANV